jgi:hypothetical protein
MKYNGFNDLSMKTTSITADLKALKKKMTRILMKRKKMPKQLPNIVVEVVVVLMILKRLRKSVKEIIG